MKYYIGVVNEVKFLGERDDLLVRTANDIDRYTKLSPASWRFNIRAAISTDIDSMLRLLASALHNNLKTRIYKYRVADYEFTVEYEVSNDTGCVWLPIKEGKTGYGVYNLSKYINEQ